MKKAIIIVGVLGVVGLGTGFILYKIQNRITVNDFNAIVNLSKNKGYDIFEGATTSQLSTLSKNYIKNFNRASHNEMITLLGLGESKWSASQKAKANKYLGKLLNKKIVS